MTTEIQADALRQITAAKTLVQTTLVYIKSRTEEALFAIEQNLLPNGTTKHGFGPIGHQAPFDLAVQTAQLSAAINNAMMLQCTGEEIQAAYARTAR
jgi:hypothetical protein